MCYRQLGSLFLLLFMLPLAGCNTEEPELPPVIRPVKTMQLTSPAQTRSQVYPGRTKAAREVHLSFRVAGQLKNFPVSVGETVTKGHLIAQLDQHDYKLAERGFAAQLEGARAAYAQADRSYKRYSNLVARNNAPQSALDEATAARDTARARVKTLVQQLAKARADLAYTTLVAPYDGYIAAKHLDNFQTVSAGTPVVKFQDVSQLEVTVGVPEDLITRRNEIISIFCEPEAQPGVQLPAELVEFSLDASASTNTYPLTVRIPPQDAVELVPGMAVNLRLTLANRQTSTGWMVPESSVVAEPDGTPKVWTVSPETSTIQAVPVQVLQVTNQGLLVSGSLQPGMHLVTAGAHFLSQGQKVRLLNQPSGSATSSEGQ